MLWGVLVVSAEVFQRFHAPQVDSTSARVVFHVCWQVFEIILLMFGFPFKLLGKGEANVCLEDVAKLIVLV